MKHTAMSNQRVTKPNGRVVHQPESFRLRGIIGSVILVDLDVDQRDVDVAVRPSNSRRSALLLSYSPTMKLYRYWARSSAPVEGRHIDEITCLGWSDRSRADAEAEARGRGRDTARRIRETGQMPDHYGYFDRPVREEIIEDHWDERGENRLWAITRNAPGVMVLNVRDVMFADIDETGPSLSDALTNAIGRLFGLGKRASGQGNDFVTRTRTAVRRVADEHALGARLYRTAVGLRGIVTSTSFDLTEASTRQLLDQFGGDPVYVRLCEVQLCFRAGLTPKPWRIGMRPPGVTFPFTSAASEFVAREWEVAYNERIASYATGELEDIIGPDVANDNSVIGSLVHLHDDFTCPDGAPLA